jgi:hypothetical protein
MAAGFSFSGVKWWLYFIAWGIGLFAATYDDPSHILAAPFFPIGLIALLPNGAQKAIIAAWLAAPAVAAVGWMLYAGVTVLIGRAKKGYAFLLVYALLCILLAFNVVGCHRTWEAAAGIR